MQYLVIENYTKSMKRTTVLDNINLSIQAGDIVGFVGENGSGKTMLFRAIAELIRPDSGAVRISGKVICRDIDFPPRLGITLENIGLWPELRGYENLSMLARINGRIGDKQIRDAICRVGLNPDDRRTFKKYSLGMKQRLLIAQAIMERPELIILDEPTNGLDAEGRERIRNVIRQENERGATILLASHNEDDIDLLCDTIFTLSNGKLISHRRRA